MNLANKLPKGHRTAAGSGSRIVCEEATAEIYDSDKVTHEWKAVATQVLELISDRKRETWRDLLPIDSR